MKVVNLKDVPKEEITSPLFTAPVTRQSPITDAESDHSIDYISFPPGVRNKFHSHSDDQILIVTEGHGIVATEKEQVEVTKGDVILAPAGEKHWHGAAANSAFTHISITAAGTKLTQVED